MNINVPAPQRAVIDLIDEYEEKRERLPQALEEHLASFDRLVMASSVQGKFGTSIGSRPYFHVETLQKTLLKSVWKAIYDRLQIDRIATARDRKKFEQTLETPPELTFDNAKATFGDYLLRPRFHILRGLAEVFVDLDQSFKSHNKVKIGVKGLPKRVILTCYGGYGSWGRDRFRDIANALAAYQGKPFFTYEEQSAIEAAHEAGEDAVLDGRVISWKTPHRKGDHKTEDRGLTVRKFSNGNAHVFFSPDALLDINRALAEFYGDVLPDAEEEGAQRKPGTEVAKDLQFYWSPKAVIDAAIDFAGIYERHSYRDEPLPPAWRVLEPSCGDGRILDALKAKGCAVFGVEYHAGRAAEARAKGYDVLTANFLETVARPDFDFVVMNPPFYGRHYLKHVNHALGFLKPGGTLVSILPATAWYDHGELKGEWRDLPVASFSESGTNVPTGMIKMRKPK